MPAIIIASVRYYCLGGYVLVSAAIASAYQRDVETLNLPCYQYAIAIGREAISGGTLRGKASKYGARYHASALATLRKIESLGYDTYTLIDRRLTGTPRRYVVIR